MPWPRPSLTPLGFRVSTRSTASSSKGYHRERPHQTRPPGAGRGPTRAAFRSQVSRLPRAPSRARPSPRGGSSRSRPASLRRAQTSPLEDDPRLAVPMRPPGARRGSHRSPWPCLVDLHRRAVLVRFGHHGYVEARRARGACRRRPPENALDSRVRSRGRDFGAARSGPPPLLKPPRRDRAEHSEAPLGKPTPCHGKNAPVIRSPRAPSSP